MTPADAQWRWFLQRSMQRRLRQREQERQDPVNIVVQNEPEPRETARVRRVLPSPG